MAEIASSTWSETDASNSTASPDGAPEGMLPSGVNDTIRQVMAALKRFWNRINGTVTTTGSSPTYIYTPVNASFPTVYTAGEVYRFIANFTCATGDRLQVNGLAVKPLYKRTRSGIVAIASGDIRSGDIVTAVYNPALNTGSGGFQIEAPALANVATSGAASDLTGLATVATSGAITDLTGTTTAAAILSDVTGPTAWTPADASGASLSITNNGSYYYKVGKLVTLVLDVTYPSTASGATAALSGLPATPSASVAPNAFVAILNTGANVSHAAGITAAGQLDFLNETNGAAFTNANLTTLRLRATISYFTA